MRYIGIIILLVFCLTLLLLTGCIVNTIIPEITSENLENQENTEKPEIESIEEPVIEEPVIEEPVIEEPVIEDTEEPETESPQKWSGLGICIYYQQVNDTDLLNVLLNNGFTELRLGVPDYQNIDWLAHSKAAVIKAVAKGAKVIWGISSNSRNNSEYTITAENWGAYRQAILDAAQWAEDNGVYEFQLGNEEELHIDGTTMTEEQIMINLKSVATDVQKIFKSGNISYTSTDSWFMNKWHSLGRGDIDILAWNIYSNHDNWKSDIVNMVTWWGTEHTYITEFSLSYVSLDDYSTDEEVQAAGVTEMIEYIKASGIERAIFYSYQNDDFGAMKFDGTYRLLWNQALLNSGSIKSITVPTKTTTISLPDTIALIPNNPDSTKPGIRL